MLTAEHETKDLVALVRHALTHQDFAAAVEHVRDALASDEHLPEAYNLLGVLHEIRGDTYEGQEAYRTALQVDPTYAPARANLAQSMERGCHESFILDEVKREMIGRPDGTLPEPPSVEVSATRTRLVLASPTPQRQKLLALLAPTSMTDPAPPPGPPPVGAAPADLVKERALAQARAVAPRHPEAVTVGLDVVISHHKTLLGLPSDEVDAKRMLSRLAGSTHTVYAGLALVHGRSGRSTTAYETVEVTLGALDPAELEAYGGRTEEVGGYALHGDAGALFVTRIEGDYQAAAGLPLHRMVRLLHQEFGFVLNEPRS